MSMHSGVVSILCIISLFVSSIMTGVDAHAIIGSVTEIDGTPVQGVLVTFTDQSNPKNSYSGFTDSEGSFEILLTPAIVGENTPQQFHLDQNYPNPFNPSTTIPYTLKIAGYVNISMYNIMGQKVRTLANGYQTAGHHTTIWNGRDKDDRSVSAGVYIYRIQTGGHTAAKKMLLIDGGGIQRGHTHGFSNRSAARTASETFYTVTAVKDGYHDYQQKHVDVEGEAFSIILTPQKIHGIAFVPIPGGTFEMGDVENAGRPDEKPVHTVTLSSFEMSACEITNAQYAQYLNEALALRRIKLMLDEYYHHMEVRGIPRYNRFYVEYFKLYDPECEISYDGETFTVNSGKETHPAICVTWWGAKDFALYYGLDLPTEAEWEYACRGGRQYMYGTNDGTIDSSKANYNDNIGHTIEVGSYPPNPFGLYDMSGNVVEICHDLKFEYTSESVINPVSPLFGSRERTCRGGFWGITFGGSNCRSSWRNGYSYISGGSWAGIRLVRRLGGWTQ
jgi:formylglycine-generating enzyme required for sulfatase activity